VSDLVEFLLARLDEDEQAARTAGADRWRATDSGVYHDDASTQPGPFAIGRYEHLGAEGTHIARHDPARVLAEVEAKRRMLEAHYDYNGVCPRCFDFSNKPVPRELWPCETVRLLAPPYGDHPDYRQEWRA
jgi:Family of unknown function (DUF6221)